MSRKIFILGVDGFIGSHLRDKHIELGDEVIGVDKDTYRTTSFNKFLKYDLLYDSEWERMKRIIRLHEPDFAYNCIAVANPDFYVKEPLLTYDIDFDLNQKIIHFLAYENIPFMHFSTSEVYGRIQPTPTLNEDNNYLILGPSQNIRWIYATSKILLEQLIISYIMKRGIQACIVRPFNFIGWDIDWVPCINMCGKEWKPRVYSCFIDQMLKDKPFQIVKPGNQKRCYCHIDDAIEGLVSILDHWENCSGEIINIGNPGNEITIFNLAMDMLRVYNEITKQHKQFIYNLIDGNDFYGPGYDDSERRYPDISKIKRLTGWEPKISMDEMLEISMPKTLKDMCKVI